MARRKAASSKRSRPGRLRIVAGKWRSRLLPIADLPGLRPTAERIRETLFNWLADGVIGKRCLDLFAGTGALGFEALSRGARTVTLVDRSRVACDALLTSAKTLDAAGVRIDCADWESYLRRPAHESYDIVFLDPPFAIDVLEQCCRLLQSNGWLADGALIYLEQDKSRPLPPLPDGWQIQKEKTAGNVRYALVRSEAGADRGS